MKSKRGKVREGRGVKSKGQEKKSCREKGK